MSKSLGNGIDPLEIIEQYGADALRASLISNTSPGNDMRFFISRVEAARNFANKMWNSARFIMMNDPDGKVKAGADMPDNLTDTDKWMLSGVNRLVKEVTENLDKYELGIAYDKISGFAWDEFCDWYVEMVKSRLYDDKDDTKEAAVWTLKTAQITLLKLLHPFMPFVTEEIFCSLQSDEESIVISSWPVYKEEFNFPAEERETSMLKDAVKAVRNMRAEKDIPPGKKVNVIVAADNDDTAECFEKGRNIFKLLARAEELDVIRDKIGVPEDALSSVIENATVYVPLEGLVDREEERKKLLAEKERLEGEVKRCEGMLANERFISKAPPAKVEEEKEKLAKYRQMLENVEASLSS